MVEEKRKYCARFNHQNENCCYAKVVEEKGVYPVINFQAELKDGQPDLNTIRNVKKYTERTACCVYCTHPNTFNGGEVFIGTVEPYFDCLAPFSCPEFYKKSVISTRKTTIWEKIKRLFKK